MNLFNWLLSNAVDIVIICVILYFGVLYWPRISKFIREHIQKKPDNALAPSSKNSIEEKGKELAEKGVKAGGGG